MVAFQLCCSFYVYSFEFLTLFCCYEAEIQQKSRRREKCIFFFFYFRNNNNKKLFYVSNELAPCLHVCCEMKILWVWGRCFTQIRFKFGRIIYEILQNGDITINILLIESGWVNYGRLEMRFCLCIKKLIYYFMMLYWEDFHWRVGLSMKY